ncbi:MAG: hypothetical protein ACLSEX_14015 [Blautia sp.]
MLLRWAAIEYLRVERALKVWEILLASGEASRFYISGRMRMGKDRHKSRWGLPV